MKRLVWLVLILAAALFAIQGGEYGTSDLVRQRQRHRLLQAQVDSLQREVDSLAAWKHALATDPALQERIAREEFGMVRGDKEVLYRFAEPESGKR
jgi:cell division protein FtsB